MAGTMIVLEDTATKIKLLLLGGFAYKGAIHNQAIFRLRDEFHGISAERCQVLQDYIRGASHPNE